MTRVIFFSVTSTLRNFMKSGAASTIVWHIRPSHLMGSTRQSWSRAMEEQMWWSSATDGTILWSMALSLVQYRKCKMQMECSSDCSQFWGNAGSIVRRIRMDSKLFMSWINCVIVADIIRRRKTQTLHAVCMAFYPRSLTFWSRNHDYQKRLKNIPGVIFSSSQSSTVYSTS